MANLALSLFEQPLFANIILPFLLIFAIVFALLQKTKILGENKAVDVIVALAVGLIFVGVPAAAGVTLKFIPIIAVILVIILGLLLTFGFLGIGKTEEGGFQLPTWVKVIVGIILSISLIVTIFWAIGWLAPVGNFFSNLAKKPWAGQLWQVLIFLGILGGVMAALIASGKKAGGK